VENVVILSILLLYIIYRKSFESGIVRGDWKKSNVTPIFKKGDKLSLLNLDLGAKARLSERECCEARASVFFNERVRTF